MRRSIEKRLALSVARDVRRGFVAPASAIGSRGRSCCSGRRSHVENRCVVAAHQLIKILEDDSGHQIVLPRDQMVVHSARLVHLQFVLRNQLMKRNHLAVSRGEVLNRSGHQNLMTAILSATATNASVM